MFKDLHELAQSATLMMVIGADGDQLRVSVTPTQVGDKTKPHVLRPLTLVGTPDELDADFATALAVWQKPKMSLIEQAQAGAGDDAEEPLATAGKPAPTSKPKSPRAGKAAGAKKNDADASGQDESQGSASAGTAVDAMMADESTNRFGLAVKPESKAAPIEAEAPVDTLTLDLF